MVPNESGNDQDDWLDGLAGRATRSALGREGEALRRVIRARETSAVDAPETDAEREDALLRKADAQLAADAQHDFSPRAARTPQPVWAIAAALMLGLAIATVWQVVSPRQDTEVMRSTHTAQGFLLVVDDPIATRLNLAEAMFDAGVDLQIASLLGDELVTAELPRPLPADVADVLAQFGIPVPPDGQLAVRITARTTTR